MCFLLSLFFFFFHAPSPSYIYTLSLHDALPISFARCKPVTIFFTFSNCCFLFSNCLLISPNSFTYFETRLFTFRSEEHTSELQSLTNLVCRLLLEKKKNKIHKRYIHTKIYRYII